MKKLYKFIVASAVILTGSILPSATALAQEFTYFVPMTPCRLFNSRITQNQVPGLWDEIQESRDFFIYNGGSSTNLIVDQGGTAECVIPGEAVAVQLVFSAVNPVGAGFLRAWPRGQAEPQATLLNWSGGNTSNSTAIEFNNDSGSDLTIKVDNINEGESTHIVGDAVGYYVPVGGVPAAVEEGAVAR